jgi:phage protein D
VAEPVVNTDFYAPRFEIKIKGTAPLPTTAVISVDIDERIDRPGMFTLTLNEWLDIDTQTFTWLDSELVRPGNEVLILFGYNAKSRKFTGKIKALSPSFPSTGIPTLKVEGYDLSHGMQKTESKVKDTDVKYSDVAKEIARKNDLTTTGVEDTLKKHKVVKRNKNESDYALLDRLARNIGYEFFVRGKTLYFRSPKDNQSKSVSFRFRKNVISFSPRLSTTPTVNEVEVTAWNERSKKPIVATARISDIETSVGIPDFDKLVEKSEGKKIKIKREGRAVKSEDEAKILAIGELKRANDGFIGGTLDCIGNPDLAPGMSIEITGVGKNWFSGTYYVKGARHSLSDAGYTTTLDVRRCL